MSRSLPFRPSKEHLKNEARQVQKACHDGRESARRLLRAQLPRLAGQPSDGGWHNSITLQEAQFALSRNYGFESWPKMIAFVEKATDQPRFAAPVKRILELAHEEAARRGKREVGFDHLLLALVGEEMRPIVGPLLEESGIRPDEMRRALEGSMSS